MRVGSLFAGIGGMDLGLERAGMRVAWQVEIDQDCQRVLRHHWPEVARYGDVREVRGQDLEPIDLLVGGFPCQDVSVAGRRAGLVGERSGLFYEFVRIAAELAPAWILIENVPGLLSSHQGRDMGAVLGVLADLGYGWAYRVLDAQWFGVPQRRRRVFIVGRAGGLADRAAEVLFEPEGCPWDSPSCREARQRAARTPAASVGSAGDGAVSEVWVYQCQGTNIGPMGTLRSGNGHVTGGVPFVAYALRAEDADASEDGTGRGTPLVPVAVGTNQRGEGRPRPVHGSLTAERSAKQFNGITDGLTVRRLMPVECERLMGLPDGWTAFDAEGQAISDSRRYHMLGNAVVANVAEWIGRRLLRVHERETRVARKE